MKRFSFAVGLFVATFTAAATFAQSPCIPGSISVEGPPFYEAWVDPSHGIDSGTGAGVVSQPSGTPSVATAQASPFKTINAAIAAVNAFTSPQSPIANPGIVHLGPATYDSSTQTFPIVMLNGVNLQGSDARSCVLREGGEVDDGVFYPDGDCDCGVRFPEDTVIVDYSFSSPEDEDEYSEMIDSVTFQGGNVHVYWDTERSGQGRVSNCLFDMINYPELRAPETGIHVVHRYVDDEGYRQINMDVFNNTFIFGWLPIGYPAALLSRVSAVGICDLNDPRCGEANPDSNTTLRNIGTGNIQNNLFRDLSQLTPVSFQRCAMLGIPSQDTAVAGSPSVNTNIFRLASTTNGSCCVNFRNPGTDTAPVSAVTIDDPAFVGEMLTNHLGMSLGDVGRDWRVMPDSLVINRGRGPVSGGPASGTITAVNGLVYTEPSAANDCTYSAIDSFDFDGEGYGNQRWIGTHPDVGFDEFEKMIDSGYGNESLKIPSSAAACSGNPGDPCYCAPFAGGGSHRMIFKTGGSVVFKFKSFACPSSSYTIPPGSDLPPALTANGLIWFTVHTQTTAQTLTQNTYTPPDTANSHTFFSKVLSSGNAGQFRLFQGKQGGIWSNLQTSFD